MYLLEKEYERYIRDVGGAIVSSENPHLKIKKIRSSLSIRQDELGTLLCLRRETISRIENGLICPTFSFVRRFSEFVALAKVIRDLEALNEIKMPGGEAVPPNLRLLLLQLDIPPEDLTLIFEVGKRGYHKSREKILKGLI